MAIPKSTARRRYHRTAADYARDAYLQNPIASATECTGITPTVPEDEAEDLSYCDVADIPVTSADGKEAHHDAK